MPTKVLLIEDNLDHAVLTRRILKSSVEEYQLEHTSQAQEGLEKILREDYNVVLCDYNLPGFSALDILRKIRESERDIPFIAVTSSGSEKIAVELMKEGASDYVIKDSSYEDTLVMVIERAIERYNVKKEKERLEKELQESNEKLKQMYELKSEFTSMVSHELRTPLTAIKEGIAIVLDGIAGELNDQQREFLDTAKKSVDRLNRLINDVLDFSKLESKKLNFKIVTGDICEIINEAINVQVPLAKEKGLFLNAELEPGIPRIEFDPDRTRQVIDNLLSNAIKFTHTGGITVTVSNDKDTQNILVCVKDTGEGIKNEDIPRLFQKFQQVGSRTQEGGTGLGLAICKEIVEQQGGKIWVESEYAKGSQFKLTLPAVHRYKILVIDDEEIVLDTCEEILKRQAYFVLRSQEGIAGFQMAQTDKPDLILLDMRLKDTSGQELIQRIRNNGVIKNIPILAISGYREEIERLEEQEEGLNLPWLSKPFDNEEFILKVKSLLKPLHT